MISGLNSRAGLLSLVREALLNPIEFSFAAVWRRAGQVLAAWPVVPLTLLCMFVLASSQSLGQGVHHPFAVGANEGATGAVQGVSGWILAREAGFYRLLSGAIRAAKQSGAAAWGLAGLSLAYGIFHAAGPGHGKMVIASYMLANERALRRGLVIAFGAALLQGFSAVAIVGIGAMVFKATAKHMTAASNVVEIASYAGIVGLGGALVYVKGAALLSAWRAAPAVACARQGDGPRLSRRRLRPEPCPRPRLRPFPRARSAHARGRIFLEKRPADDDGGWIAALLGRNSRACLRLGARDFFNRRFCRFGDVAWHRDHHRGARQHRCPRQKRGRQIFQSGFRAGPDRRTPVRGRRRPRGIGIRVGFTVRGLRGRQRGQLRFSRLIGPW